MIVTSPTDPVILSTTKFDPTIAQTAQQKVGHRHALIHVHLPDELRVILDESVLVGGDQHWHQLRQGAAHRVHQHHPRRIVGIDDVAQRIWEIHDADGPFRTMLIPLEEGRE